MVKTKKMNIDCGRNPIIFLNKNSELIEKEGFEAMKRVRIAVGDKNLVATLNIVESDILSGNEVGLCDKSFKLLGGKEGLEATISHVGQPESFKYIKDKMFGHPFTEKALFEITEDIVKGNYSDSHMASFCTVCEGGALSEDEIAFLTKAMVQTGQTIDWGYDIVVDKHCIGGVPGNRTTNVAIPIVAEFGLHIPKTSSRAITSPSGTADTMEVVSKVDLNLDEMKKVVHDHNGCLVWGGSVDLSPSDDIIINAKRAINVDSEGQMIASILSKKIAAGSTHALIDIPVGPTAKVTSQEKGERLKHLFETIGEKAGIHVKVVLTDGIQPIGKGIGPSLEVHDIISVLKNEPNAPQDLKEKAIKLAGMIIEFSPDVKEGEGAKIARDIIESGKAWTRFEAIAKAQNGGHMNPIPESKKTGDVLAEKDGKVTSIDNKKLTQMCRLAGAPENKAAGVYLHHHLNEEVKKGDKLLTVHADSEGELREALDLAKQFEVVKID